MKYAELVYSQSSGGLSLRPKTDDENPTRLGAGYAGHPPYVNSPDAEALVARGPIPRGRYRVVGPFNHLRLGPCVFYLEPDPNNTMFGRSGFFIHGDNEYGNRTASHGCIVLRRTVRDAIHALGPSMLTVV